MGASREESLEHTERTKPQETHDHHLKQLGAKELQSMPGALTPFLHFPWASELTKLRGMSLHSDRSGNLAQ